MSSLMIPLGIEQVSVCETEGLPEAFCFCGLHQSRTTEDILLFYVQ